jgi:hypothetical protein
MVFEIAAHDRTSVSTAADRSGRRAIRGRRKRKIISERGYPANPTMQSSLLAF